jgi:hypothetical protein
MKAASKPDWRRWLETRDRQQERLLPDREERFNAIVAALR